MKEDRNLRRCWARVTLLGCPDPYHRGVAQRSPTQVPSSCALCPYPTICRLWVDCPCGWSGRPSPSWSPLLGGRQSAALPDWSFCGAQHLGKAATWCPQVVFLPAGKKGHHARLVGTATPLQGHRRPGPVRASAHPSQVLVGAGVTPAHGPAPSAPVEAADRSCAHGRVNSDRAADRPCSRLIRPGTASPHGSLACWFSDTQWAASSTAIRANITRPGCTSCMRGHASGRPHSVPLANNGTSCCPLLYCGSTWASGADPLPIKVLGVHGWSLTRDHHAGNGADIAVSSPADALEACRMESGRLGTESPYGANREGRNPQLKKDINLQETLNHGFRRPHSQLNLTAHCRW